MAATESLSEGKEVQLRLISSPIVGVVGCCVLNDAATSRSMDADRRSPHQHMT